MNFKKTLLSIAIASASLTPAFSYSAPLLLDNTVHQTSQIAGSNAWLEISLGQFKSNIEQFKSHIAPQTKICAVMKADAYGNGIRGLMPTILEQQIPCVAIASNAEAKLVRESGFEGELIRVRSASTSEIEQAISLDIEELIGSEQQARELASLAEKY